jgi:hypothetical protein
LVSEAFFTYYANEQAEIWQEQDFESRTGQRSEKAVIHGDTSPHDEDVLEHVVQHVRPLHLDGHPAAGGRVLQLELVNLAE